MSEATDQQEEQQAEEQTPEQKRIAELEASQTRLEGALKNEREAHKATKTKAQTALSEEDQAEFERLREEEQKRKGEELVPRAEVSKMVEEATKEQLGKMAKERDKAVKTAQETEGRLDKLVLRDAIHKGVAEVKGVQPGAVEDIIALAERGAINGVNFVRDGLDIHLRNDNDLPLPGPDGEGNMEIQHWLEGQRESKPHWFVPNQGGGPGPGTGGSATAAAAANGKDVSKWTIQQKTAFVKEHGPEEWAKLVATSSAA